MTSLDADRILRSYLALIDATLRTNYYKQDSPGPGPGVDGPRPLVLKLDPGTVPGIVEPRPKFEIFVFSPRLEAVHLRFGRVARGGLRWSDRLEDFRTEVLGLVKAQEVKNAVIVPAGAKGGFVCKQLPDPADREAYQAEVLACYKTFIAAMLDVTDNIDGDRVVPPPGVVRRDGDDPYLVVAADKGTATFSDTANEIAGRFGFWLGDAFASGGSEGYDHKKMGITARGAWESVKWHFAALGLNPATDDFTAVGVGDMSGDVFGNGMLLSDHIRLVAAFDHRHVFIDPSPDAAASFAERSRLFALPRSSWADYDQALISPGGGVWPRSVKSVPVSPQARTALGIDAAVSALSPDELISAILAAPVDLLWNGGIGTYVKASSESNADVGDRSNDAVRIDATRLRARVVGEGGNLGFTQAARIEYSLGGGLMNTDFIDNSAGVDTSDHEVNIKILLADAIRDGAIPASGRHELLNEMTDEVASLVLRHNYGQNMALAVARAQAPSLLHVHARYLRKLTRDKRLNPEQDVLPGEREIAERRSSGGGLTNPELALLLAHTKIWAAEDVLASSLPDDPYLRRVLDAYFPAPMRARFADRMDAHPLRREIITTSVVNEMIDTSGIHVPVPADRGDRRVGARPDPGVAGGPRGVRHVGVLVSGRGPGGPGRHRGPDHAAARGAQADRARGPVAAAQPAPAVRPPGHRGLLRRWRQDRPFGYAQAAHRPGPGRVRGAARLLPRPGSAARPGRTGRRHGADVLRLRHRAGRRLVRAPDRGDRRGLLRPGRPAADHPAAGPHHRAAARGPLVHHGPGRAARRPVRRARLAHRGRARGQRTRALAGGTAGRLGVPQ